MEPINQIIDFCTSNRVSTTEVADALGKSGVLEGVLPINSNQFKVGIVRTIFAANNSNYAVHEQIRDVQKGEIVLILSFNCDGRAIIGDLITKYLLLYKGAAAVIVQGLVRDASRLRKEGYAVWSKGVSPLGCFNTPSDPFPEDIQQEMRQQYEGGIAICDDGGVTIIPREQLNNEMLTKLRQIEMQEDIWFFCLDTLKWDTKKIVCDKAYLTEQEFLSNKHIEQLSQMIDTFDFPRE